MAFCQLFLKYMVNFPSKQISFNWKITNWIWGNFFFCPLENSVLGSLYWRTKWFLSSIHSVPSYKERSYKERLVEMPKSKERWLVEFGALKEHLSSSTVKNSLFQGISELIKSLLKDYFKLNRTSSGNPRSCYLFSIPS